MEYYLTDHFFYNIECCFGQPNIIWEVENCSVVNVGQVICTIAYTTSERNPGGERPYKPVKHNFELVSNTFGTIIYGDDVKKGRKLCSIINHGKGSHYAVIDSTRPYNIVWEDVFGENYFYIGIEKDSRCKSKIRFAFSCTKDKAYLTVYGILNYTKYTVVKFILSNYEHVEFEAPHIDRDYLCYSLTKNDFLKMMSHPLSCLHIYNKGTEGHYTEYENDYYKDDYISKRLFADYCRAFLNTVMKCGLDWDVFCKDDCSQDEYNQEQFVQKSSCYVYLMEDKSNHYYKIGMSKTPEYREKTLQSEKPTIELLCAKEFSSRDDARRIESMLHRLFSNSRIRGEWFRLNDDEVYIVKTYLNNQDYLSEL